MEKKVGKNYLYNLSYQLLLVVLPLITTPYISRVLGAKGVGTFGYTNSIIQYFTLFGCIGLTLYGQREIAYYQNDISKRNKVFFELFFLRLISMSISTIIFYVGIMPRSQYSAVFLVQTFDLVGAIVDISWFFQGIEEFKKIVIRNYIVRLVSVAMIFTFVKSPDDLLIYVLCYSGTIFFGNISIWFYLPKYVKWSDCKGINIKRHLRPALDCFVPQIAMSLYIMLDKTMIGFIAKDTSEVAYYEQSQTIIKTVMTLITSLSTAMMPRIANLYKNNEMDQVRNFMHFSLNFVICLAIPFVLGIIGITSGFVPWFFGPGYVKVIPNMIIIAPIILFTGLSTVLGTQYLLSLGRQKQYTVSIVIGSATNIVLNIILITYFKSIGAAIATLIAEAMVCFVQVIILRKEFDFKKILFSMIKYTCFGLVMLAVVVGLKSILSVSIISTFIEILAGGIVYGILLIVSKDPLIEYVKDNVLKKNVSTK